MKWIKVKPGVRYREHPTRKHGIRPDRYYTIFYKMDGKTVTEAVGWASRGITASKCTGILSELAENRRRGEPPFTLKEKRAMEQARRKKEEEKAEQTAKDSVTFKTFFEGFYTELVQNDKRPRTWEREKGLVGKWIMPTIGNLPLKDIAAFDIERIKKRMAKSKLAPRTVAYALAVVRHIINVAIDHDIITGPNPVRKVKLPTADNKRLRYLSREEAAALLAELAKVSADTHDMALLSLHCGLRFGEVAALTWRDVDLDAGILTLRNTKSGKTRPAFLTAPAKAMLQARQRPWQNPEDLVFPAAHGKKRERVSNTFRRAVDDLGFNKGVKDPRHKVVFHSLRHSFASWHAEAGTNLSVLQGLLGHATIEMTQRYSHIGESALRAAVKRLDSTFTATEKATVTPIKAKK